MSDPVPAKPVTKRDIHVAGWIGNVIFAAIGVLGTAWITTGEAPWFSPGKIKAAAVQESREVTEQIVRQSVTPIERKLDEIADAMVSPEDVRQILKDDPERTIYNMRLAGLEAADVKHEAVLEKVDTSLRRVELQVSSGFSRLESVVKNEGGGK